MKAFKGIVIGLLALAAILFIASAGKEDEANLTNQWPIHDRLVYAGILMASVVYLHYLMMRYLVPLNLFSAKQKELLSRGAQDYYSKSFFKGTLGLGYFLAVIYIFGYLILPPPTARPPSNFLIPAMFFIALGVFAKTRGLILYLAQKEGAFARDSI